MTPRQESWPGEPLEADEDDAVEEPKAEAEVGEDTQEPEPEDEVPEEELPRLRGPSDAHAPGELEIPDEIAVLEGTPNGSRRGVAIGACAICDACDGSGLRRQQRSGDHEPSQHAGRFHCCSSPQ